MLHWLIPYSLNFVDAYLQEVRTDSPRKLANQKPRTHTEWIQLIGINVWNWKHRNCTQTVVALHYARSLHVDASGTCGKFANKALLKNDGSNYVEQLSVTYVCVLEEVDTCLRHCCALGALNFQVPTTWTLSNNNYGIQYINYKTVCQCKLE
eukprot:gb/GECG01015365.1/.p1 GENE.gb/GECG01015365.1/~~gb/GECG01015365.1/.p1  ORF type:complete len:152 (+),score=10.61 gb/GECG01015365.1/:1-456(+)